MKRFLKTSSLLIVSMFLVNQCSCSCVLPIPDYVPINSFVIALPSDKLAMDTQSFCGNKLSVDNHYRAYYYVNDSVSPTVILPKGSSIPDKLIFQRQNKGGKIYSYDYVSFDFEQSDEIPLTSAGEYVYITGETSQFSSIEEFTITVKIAEDSSKLYWMTLGATSDLQADGTYSCYYYIRAKHTNNNDLSYISLNSNIEDTSKTYKVLYIVASENATVSPSVGETLSITDDNYKITITSQNGNSTTSYEEEIP